MQEKEQDKNLTYPCNNCEKYSWCDYPCDRYEEWHQLKEKNKDVTQKRKR